MTPNKIEKGDVQGTERAFRKHLEDISPFWKGWKRNCPFSERLPLTGKRDKKSEGNVPSSLFR
jgi:hypothetical protein